MLLGADVGQLLGYVGQVLQHRRRIRDATRRMERLIEGANWVGPDRERFVENWTAQYRPMMYSILQELADDVGKLRQHAERQRQTSSGE